MDHAIYILFRFYILFHSQLLDVSRNQLNGIEDSQVIMLQKIDEVRLENNPLICDRCHMGKLIQIAKAVSLCPYFFPFPSISIEMTMHTFIISFFFFFNS